MKTKIALFSIVALALAGLGPAAAQDKQNLNLSLEDCIAKALEKQPERRGRTDESRAGRHLPDQSPGIVLAAVRPQLRQQPPGEPLQLVDFGRGHDHQQALRLRRDYFREPSRRAGIFLFRSKATSRTRTRPSSSSIRATAAPLRFDFTQPLLKNFGPKVSPPPDPSGRDQCLDIAENQLQNTILDTIYLVQEAYWNLCLCHRKLRGEEAVAPARPRPPGQE